MLLFTAKSDRTSRRYGGTAYNHGKERVMTTNYDHHSFVDGVLIEDSRPLPAAVEDTTDPTTGDIKGTCTVLKTNTDTVLLKTTFDRRRVRYSPGVTTLTAHTTSCPQRHCPGTYGVESNLIRVRRLEGLSRPGSFDSMFRMYRLNRIHRMNPRVANTEWRNNVGPWVTLYRCPCLSSRL